MSAQEIFPSLPTRLQKKIGEELGRRTRIETSQVQEWLDALQMPLEALMLHLLPSAAEYARVPISAYKVGAVAQGRRGLYFGANMEFGGQALNASVHAEQSAVTHAWLHGETQLNILAVSAPPCGHCRQFLNELNGASSLQILLPEHPPFPLSECLPQAFGPQNLGISGGLMACPQKEVRLALKESSQDPLVLQALQGAKKSYAPYTQNYAGCALQTTDGQVVAGRYSENAAHNPSLPPLQSGLAFLNMNLPLGQPWSLQRVVLVEKSAPCSQREATRAVLFSIAPQVHLEYHLAT